jgi:hypothetical protein
VIERHVRQDRDHRRDDVRRVEAPSQADLDHSNVDLRRAKVLEGDRCDRLELAWHVGIGKESRGEPGGH